MFLALTNDFRANLIVLYRFLSIYLSVWPKAETGVGVEVGAQKTARIRTGVLLLLVEALPALQRVQGLAI